ncbi:hypothetical protein [Peribacillus butanolivorans]
MGRYKNISFTVNELEEKKIKDLQRMIDNNSRIKIKKISMAETLRLCVDFTSENFFLESKIRVLEDEVIRLTKKLSEINELSQGYKMEDGLS